MLEDIDAGGTVPWDGTSQWPDASTEAESQKVKVLVVLFMELLGGGFKDFLCSPLFGEDSHFN